MVLGDVVMKQDIPKHTKYSDFKMVLLFFFFECLFIFERKRERERESRGGGAEREGDRGSEVSSVLTAESPIRGSNSRTGNHDVSSSQTLN